MIESTLNISIEKNLNPKLASFDFNNLQFGKSFSDHMFVVDFENNEWVNARIIPYQRFDLSPSSAVIHYGQSIFEGMKAYKNELNEVMLFRPLDNFKRLNTSAVRMCMPEVPQDVFMEGLVKLIQLDSDWIPKKTGQSLYIRPFLFATDEFIGVKPSETYRFVIITSPAGAYYSEPVKVLVENTYTRAVEGGIGFVKAAGNYGRSLYPAKKAQELGYHQLIWTDAYEHKYIEESGTMNVLFVINDVLITPPVSTTILAGITRDSVLTLARDWGMKVEERKIKIDEIIDAFENNTISDAFGTGTAATIAHISHIGYNGKDYALPVIESRKFSNKIKEELQKIRLRETGDIHNWVMKIK